MKTKPRVLLLLFAVWSHASAMETLPADSGASGPLADPCKTPH